ncbi:hypothetical protein CSC94_01200 [Zhengella mangrovi]|uniref:Zinc-ribbon domain-containing protein n=1 Tax=Zhengella mangrovi TaxID=1982044 RepID=A0A2G1QTW0_9HYPH|nr:zinc ribbon domain-containing protein [Zhengella mangrovi]PHP68648.1 hypothetical protein CSC94_01200 [Zhengella mangrovi]
MNQEAARFCPRCGNPLSDGETFCWQCGAPVASDEGDRRVPVAAQAAAGAASVLLWAFCWAGAWAIGVALACFIAFQQVGGTFAILGRVSSAGSFIALMASLYGAAGLVAGAMSGLAVRLVDGADTPGARTTVMIAGGIWLAAFASGGFFALQHTGPLPSGNGDIYSFDLSAFLVATSLALGVCLGLLAVYMIRSSVPRPGIRAVKIVTAFTAASGAAGVGAALAVMLIAGAPGIVRFAN